MWARLRNQLRFLFRRDRFDRELAEEMDFHREMLEVDKTRQGLAHEAAVASARRQLGNTTLAGEFSRDVWIIAWLDTLLADLRYAFRTLRRSPGVALGVLLSLAATRLVSTFLYGVEPNDPATLALSALTLAAVAVGAAMIPARRAARLDPMTALRED